MSKSRSLRTDSPSKHFRIGGCWPPSRRASRATAVRSRGRSLAPRTFNGAARRRPEGSRARPPPPSLRPSIRSCPWVVCGVCVPCQTDHAGPGALPQKGRLETDRPLRAPPIVLFPYPKPLRDCDPVGRREGRSALQVHPPESDVLARKQRSRERIGCESKERTPDIDFWTR
jgi:hypothetical protein